MMVNGLMIKKVGLGKRHGRTELIIKVYTKMVKNMDRGNLFGTMAVNMVTALSKANFYRLVLYAYKYSV